MGVRPLLTLCGVSALLGAILVGYKGLAILATNDQPDHAFEIAPFFFGVSALTLVYAVIDDIQRPRWLLLTFGWLAAFAGVVAAIAHFAGREDDFGDLGYLVEHRIDRCPVPHDRSRHPTQEASRAMVLRPDLVGVEPCFGDTHWGHSRRDRREIPRDCPPGRCWCLGDARRWSTHNPATITSQPPRITASMRGWAVSRARWIGPGSWSFGLGSVVGRGRLHSPEWGEAVRCLGIHPLRTRQGRVVCMERYGHSVQLGSITCLDPHQRWRWGHAVRRARNWRCARTVHAALSRQRISPSRIP